MAIEITSENLSKNIKVNPVFPVQPGDVNYQAFIDAYTVNLSDPKAKAIVPYTLPLNPDNPDMVGWLAIGTIETTTEWLIALIQAVINLDLGNSKLPLIPITGEFDCATQQAMVMEAGGARGVDPNTLNIKVSGIGPIEFGYILSMRDKATSPTLSQMITDANFGGTPPAHNMTDFANGYSVIVPVGKEGDVGYIPLKFTGVNADPKCADWKPAVEDKKDGLDQVKDTNGGVVQPPTKSYFWPIVGGLTVGAVVIGGGYYLMKDNKSKATTSS